MEGQQTCWGDTVGRRAECGWRSWRPCQAPAVTVIAAFVPLNVSTLARWYAYRSSLLKLSLLEVVDSVSEIALVSRLSQLLPSMEPWICTVDAPAPALVAPRTWIVFTPAGSDT